MYDKNSNEISQSQKIYLQKLKRRKINITISRVLILVIIFSSWEITANLGIIDPFIFSSPSRMLKALINMLKDGSLWLHIGITLFETVVGFLLGTFIGVGVAIIMWWNKFISDVLEPYLVVLNSLPKTALAPIIIVWMGNNMSSIIVVALLTSVIVTLLSVYDGFMHIDEDKIKLIKTFGGTKKQILFKVILPASIPTMVNALKINIGLSYVGVIVGEFLVAKAGLGYLITYSSQTFKLDVVMLSVIILAILSALMYQAVSIIEKLILKKINPQ